MQLIRARADDWRPNNPRISAGGWIGAIVVVAALYVVAAAAIGHFANGNGAPFLSQPAEMQRWTRVTVRG